MNYCKKHPVGNRNADMDSYIDIIRRNNVHYLDYNPDRGINTSNDQKFKTIIKPHITMINFLTKSKQLEKERKQKERQRFLEQADEVSPISRPCKGSDPSIEPRSLRSRTGSVKSILSSTKIGRNIIMDFNDEHRI